MSRDIIYERCPKCGQIGTIDEEQFAGKVSIRCICGNHYYRGKENG